MPTNNNVKQNNKQIVNVYLADLIRKRKKRARARTPAQQPEIQPETLQAAAGRMRPSIYPATNVIISNPNGSTSSPMFDIQKSQQLQQYENIRSMITQQMGEIQSQLNALSNGGGNPDVIQALSQELDAYRSYINSEDSMSEMQSTITPSNLSKYDDTSIFSDVGSSVYQFREMPSEQTGIQLYDNQVFGEPAEREMELPKAPPQADFVDDSPNEYVDEAIMKKPVKQSGEKYNMDIELDEPMPSTSTQLNKDGIIAPKYSTIYSVRDDGPMFSSDINKNKEIVNMFTKDVLDLKSLFENVPLKNKYTSVEYKEFRDKMREHLFTYQNAYKRVLSPSKKSDLQGLKTIEELISGGIKSIKYPTFTKMSNKLLKALRQR